MSVLVTRSAPGDEATLNRLNERGIIAISSPVLEIQECPPPEPNWLGVQALAVTSSAGAHAIKRYESAKSLLVFAVGDRTEAALRAAGFDNIRSAHGDGAALVELAAAQLHPQRGNVVHIRGAEAAVDVAAELIARGFSAESLVAYRAEPATTLNEQALTALRAGEVSTILFHSAAGTRAFLSLAARSALSGHFSNMDAVALSPRVAAPLDSKAWRAILTAAAPNEESLLALIASNA